MERICRLCQTLWLSALIQGLIQYAKPTAANSLRLTITHEEKFAVSEIHEQEEISLNGMDSNLQEQVEADVRQFDMEQAPVENRDMHMRRRKRQINFNDLANQYWTKSYNDQKPPTLEEEATTEIADFEVISEEEVLRAKNIQLRRVLGYLGYMLAAVAGFSFLALCFLLEPKKCMMAFGTGSPCCLLLSPCVLACLTKVDDPAKAVQENVNLYAPGIIIHEDGKAEFYKPSEEELACMEDVMEKVAQLGS